MSRKKNPRVTAYDGVLAAMIKTRRISLGITQPELAEAIGVSFQQVQKYERGINRVSVSTLVMIARALQVSPSFFFQPSARSSSAMPELLTKEDLTLLRAFKLIKGSGKKKEALSILQNFSRKTQRGK